MPINIPNSLNFSNASGKLNDSPIAQTRAIIPSATTLVDDEKLCALLNNQNRESERIMKIRQNMGLIDDEEHDILKSIETRNMNRRVRHENRKAINSMMRTKTNEELSTSGHLGRAPLARSDSVISWNAKVKTPQKSKAEKELIHSIPSTPVMLPKLFLPNNKEPHDSAEVLGLRISKTLQFIKSGRSRSREVIRRLATDFCSYFFILHAHEVYSHQPILTLKTTIEIDALKVLRNENSFPDLKFIMTGIFASIPNLDLVLRGKIPHAPINANPFPPIDEEPSTPLTKRLLYAPCEGTTQRQKNKRTSADMTNASLWLSNDDKFCASVQSASTKFFVTQPDRNRES